MIGSHDLRDLENTDIPFSISSSGHLCRPFNHKILNVALLRLRFCSIRDDKSDLNLSVKPGKSVFIKSLITDPVPASPDWFAVPVGGGLVRPVIRAHYVDLPARLGLMFAGALLLAAAALFAVPAGAGAADLGTPSLSAPLQLEKFFDTERLTTGGDSAAAPELWEPQFGLSHMAREDEGGVMTKQTTHRVHGEAGGRLNLLENLSFTAVAKLPLYTHESRWGQTMSDEGRSSADIIRRPASNLSWRSELGLNLGKGIDINLFYDRSLFGKIDKPGVEETDEKFGTRFIIRFK